MRIPRPPRLRRRRHAPRKLSPPRPRPPPQRERAELNLSRIARKFSAFGAVRIPKPPHLRRRRHAPRNTSPPRPRPPPQLRASRGIVQRLNHCPFGADPRSASRLPICKACLKGGKAWVVRSLGHGAARSRHHLESAEFHFLGQNVIYILKYLQQRHLYMKVPPRNNCHFTTRIGQGQGLPISKSRGSKQKYPE